MPLLRIGDQEYDLTPARLRSGYGRIARENPDWFGPQSEIVYFWSCARMKGIEHPRPEFFKVRAFCSFDVHDEISGERSDLRTDRNKTDQRDQTGLSLERIEMHLREKLPTLRLPIPYDKLIDPHKEDYVLDVVAKIDEMIFFGEPVRSADPLVAPPKGHIWVSYPYKVEFEPMIYHKCTGPLTLGDDLNTESARLELSRVAREMHDDETEARQA